MEETARRLLLHGARRGCALQQPPPHGRPGALEEHIVGVLEELLACRIESKSNRNRIEIESKSKSNWNRIAMQSESAPAETSCSEVLSPKCPLTFFAS